VIMENARGMQDDTISKRQAIDAVRAALLSWSYMPEWRDNKIIEAVEQLPTIQPTDNLQKLADKIASFKRCVKSDNSDYLTGYLCALSVVEGMIADMRGE